jgi:hypothetical protein
MSTFSNFHIQQTTVASKKNCSEEKMKSCPVQIALRTGSFYSALTPIIYSFCKPISVLSRSTERTVAHEFVCLYKGKVHGSLNYFCRTRLLNVLCIIIRSSCCSSWLLTFNVSRFLGWHVAFVTFRTRVVTMEIIK